MTRKAHSETHFSRDHAGKYLLNRNKINLVKTLIQEIGAAGSEGQGDKRRTKNYY